MPYYLDLFSPETYEAFSRSQQDISGFRERQEKDAGAIGYVLKDSLGEPRTFLITNLNS